MVYFAQALDGGPIKIGYATDPSSRLSRLQTSSPAPLRLIRSLPGERETEAALHRRFAHLRVHREWFRADDELIRFIAEFEPEPSPGVPQTNIVRLPAAEMERVRRAARSIGLSLSAFIRQAVLEKAVDVERRMKP